MEQDELISMLNATIIIVGGGAQLLEVGLNYWGEVRKDSFFHLGSRCAGILAGMVHVPVDLVHSHYPHRVWSGQVHEERYDRVLWQTTRT